MIKNTTMLFMTVALPSICGLCSNSIEHISPDASAVVCLPGRYSLNGDNDISRTSQSIEYYVFSDNTFIQVERDLVRDRVNICRVGFWNVDDLKMYLYWSMPLDVRHPDYVFDLELSTDGMMALGLSDRVDVPDDESPFDLSMCSVGLIRYKIVNRFDGSDELEVKKAIVGSVIQPTGPQ